MRGGFRDSTGNSFPWSRGWTVKMQMNFLSFAKLSLAALGSSGFSGFLQFQPLQCHQLSARLHEGISDFFQKWSKAELQNPPEITAAKIITTPALLWEHKPSWVNCYTLVHNMHLCQKTFTLAAAPARLVPKHPSVLWGLAAHLFVLFLFVWGFL